MTMTFVRSVDRDDPERPIPRPYGFFMGADGLQHVLHNGQAKLFESLLSIGLNHHWMHYNVVELGFRFVLIVLPATAGYHATWDNVKTCVLLANPELRSDCEEHFDRCSSANVLEDANFIVKYKSKEAIEEAFIDSSPDMFLTPRRYLQRTQRTWVDFRVLLWTWFGLNSFFVGDGFTKDAVTGQKGYSEFLVPNRTLGALVNDFAAVLQMVEVAVPPEHPLAAEAAQ